MVDCHGRNGVHNFVVAQRYTNTSNESTPQNQRLFQLFSTPSFALVYGGVDG